MRGLNGVYAESSTGVLSWEFLSDSVCCRKKGTGERSLNLRHFELSANRNAVGESWHAEPSGTSQRDWRRARPTGASGRGVGKGRNRPNRPTHTHTHKDPGTGNELIDRANPPPVDWNAFPSPRAPIPKRFSWKQKNGARGTAWEGWRKGPRVTDFLLGPSSCLSLSRSL